MNKCRLQWSDDSGKFVNGEAMLSVARVQGPEGLLEHRLREFAKCDRTWARRKDTELARVKAFATPRFIAIRIKIDRIHQLAPPSHRDDFGSYAHGCEHGFNLGHIDGIHHNHLVRVIALQKSRRDDFFASPENEFSVAMRIDVDDVFDFISNPNGGQKCYSLRP